MTKVAIKSPTEGVGNYNLKVPVTEDDHEVELPLGSTHLSGANAEGMPQLNDGTPIVESGSNSDGVWAKFAEGTLLARKMGALRDNITIGVGSVFRSNGGTWFYPVPFVGGTPMTWADNEINTGWVSTYSATSSQVNLFHLSSISQAANYNANASAFGYWK